jgi:hypothetical protein
MRGSTPHWEWLPDSSMIKIIPNRAAVDVAWFDIGLPGQDGA